MSIYSYIKVFAFASLFFVTSVVSVSEADFFNQNHNFLKLCANGSNNQTVKDICAKQKISKGRISDAFDEDEIKNKSDCKSTTVELDGVKHSNIFIGICHLTPREEEGLCISGSYGSYDVMLWSRQPYNATGFRFPIVACKPSGQLLEALPGAPPRRKRKDDAGASTSQPRRSARIQNLAIP